MKTRRHVVVAAVGVLLVGVLGSCQMGQKIGATCRAKDAWGTAGGMIVQCRASGRTAKWAPVMSIADYLRLMASLNKAPADSTTTTAAPTTTTTSTAPTTTTAVPTTLAPTTTTVAVPAPKKGMLATSSYATCALDGDGVAYCWGRASQGETGDNQTTTDRTVPVRVTDGAGNPSTLRFTSIVGAGGHFCALTSDGVAYCWGANGLGELGTDDTSNRGIPTKVKAAGGADSALRFKALTAGHIHTCGLTTDGTAYCWGQSANGRLGNNETSPDRSTPVLVRDNASQPSPLRFTKISSHDDTTCALTASGQAYCWGAGANGTLGNNSSTDSSTPVAVTDSAGNPSPLRFNNIALGNAHGCATTSDGTAYCFGYNLQGQLGDNSLLTREFPTQVRDASGLSPLRFSTITSGIEHTCGIESSVAYCWGSASNGRLGNNTTTPNVKIPQGVRDGSGLSPLRFDQISAADHTCGVTTSGDVYCWGPATNGRLGNGSSSGDVLVPGAVQKVGGGGVFNIYR